MQIPWLGVDRANQVFCRAAALGTHGHAPLETRLQTVSHAFIRNAHLPYRLPRISRAFLTLVLSTLPVGSSGVLTARPK